MLKSPNVYAVNQQILLPFLSKKGISLYIKREDQLHPFISGNKLRKLKYNLMEAISKGLSTILTFGGAYSNHIVATAYAAKEQGLGSIGIIRGEELENNWGQNPTLSLAAQQGMRFRFISRDRYRQRDDSVFLGTLKETFPRCYVLPEGGTNSLAVKGCQEILSDKDFGFDVICSSTGTGGTLAGIINSSQAHQQVLGFPALKGNFIKEDICKFVSKKNWEVQTDYHFGGYAKVTKELIAFINNFRQKTQIPLDPVYTGKMMFGILGLVQQDYFKPGTKILAIHTGGLQGITGMNLHLKKKNLPLIEI